MAETITISTTTLLLIIWLVTDPPDIFGIISLLFWLLLALLKFMFQMLFTTFGVVVALISSFFIWGHDGPMFILCSIGVFGLIGLVLSYLYPHTPKENDQMEVKS